MRGNLFEDNDIKPVFSGHETFPLRYGWLKKTYDEVTIAEKDARNAKDIFNDPKSISAFGVGKNMVASMRYWASYTGILEDNGITDNARDFLSDDGLDPWMEHPTTLWFLHWRLVYQAKQETLVTFHWFFNYYNGDAFNRQQLNASLQELCEARGWKLPSTITLTRDIECFIRMYVGKHLSPGKYDDSSIESPLSELALIKPLGEQGLFSPNRGSKPNISTGMFLWAVANFWDESFQDASSLSLEALMYDAGSPGRIFLLDENAMLEQIYRTLDNTNEYISWSETAGMRQFTRGVKVSIQNIKDYAYKLIQEEYQ